MARGNDIKKNVNNTDFIWKAICLDAALRNLEQEYGDSITNLQLEPKLTLLALSDCIWLSGLCLPPCSQKFCRAASFSI